MSWKDTYYVTIYELRRSGIDAIANVAGVLKVKPETLSRWLATNPAVKDAWDRGGDSRGANPNAKMREYIYDRLPPKLQTLWAEIEAVEKEPNGLLRLEALFSRAGKRARQHLFLHALSQSMFNASEACRKVGISKATLDSWIQTDPDFAALADEVVWHRKNWLDSKLFRLIDAGDSPATIFAAKTQNRDRGYSDKVTVEHTGTIQHEHSVLNIEALDLPLDVKRLVLEAVRRQLGQEGISLPALPGHVEPGGEDWVEGEFTEIEDDYETDKE